jgi:hypothetical protein
MPSSYDVVDPILQAWSKRNRLELTTEYQDAEVRSFDVPHRRKHFQLWIEPLLNDTVKVQTCDHASPWHTRAENSVIGDAEDLDQLLDQMLRWIRSCP